MYRRIHCLLAALLIRSSASMPLAVPERTLCKGGQCDKLDMKYERIVPVQPGIQWPDNGGYCGSWASQRAILGIGAWVSQQQVRDHTVSCGHGAHDEEILSCNIVEAWSNLKIDFNAFDYNHTATPQIAAYQTWLKKQLVSGYAVTWAIMWDGQTYPVYGLTPPSGMYGHYEPVIGIQSNHPLDDPKVSELHRLKPSFRRASSVVCVSRFLDDVVSNRPSLPPQRSTMMTSCCTSRTVATAPCIGSSPPLRGHGPARAIQRSAEMAYTQSGISTASAIRTASGGPQRDLRTTSKRQRARRHRLRSTHGCRSLTREAARSRKRWRAHSLRRSSSWGRRTRFTAGTLFSTHLRTMPSIRRAPSPQRRRRTSTRTKRAFRATGRRTIASLRREARQRRSQLK